MEKKATASKKKKEAVPLPFESDVKEYIKQIEDLQTKVKDFTAKIKQLDKDCAYKDEEIIHWKKIAEDMSEKVQFYEHREKEQGDETNVQKMEIVEMQKECVKLKEDLKIKSCQVEDINRKMLKMKDEHMDYEASVDKVNDKEKYFKEEMITLSE